jgi:hypothetical protein
MEEDVVVVEHQHAGFDLHLEFVVPKNLFHKMKIFESYYDTYKKGGDVVVGVYRMLTEE